MYKVSVIVPVYNVGKYIVRCAESLFRQTLDDMQFIFVDDASTDDSIVLLKQTIERFPHRKPQILILHHPENRGLPAARATGLAHVKSDYVAHCDSDDYVEPSMYAKLYKKAQQSNSDMVICGRIIHRSGKEYINFDKNKPGEDLICSFLCGRISPSVWGRLIKTDIYQQVLFPTESVGEDIVQIVQLLYHAKRISYIEEALYHYILDRPESFTNNIYRKNIKKRVEQFSANYTLMHNFVVEHYRINEKEFVLRKAIVKRLYLPHIYQKRFRRLYLKTFPEINFYMLFCRKIPFSYKISHLLILLGLYSHLQRIQCNMRNYLYATLTVS